MKTDFGMSRRGFLRSAGSLGGVACLRLTGPALVAISQAACSAREDAAPFSVLGDSEARDLAAIAARIIPTTDTPGATEAGVIHFIDKAFGAEMQDMLAAAREGLAGFNAALAEAHPGSPSLAVLGEEEQDAFLKTQENTDFFDLAWVMTVFGFFSMPKYGGNKDHVGWELIGFEGHHGVGHVRLVGGGNVHDVHVVADDQVAVGIEWRLDSVLIGERLGGAAPRRCDRCHLRAVGPEGARHLGCDAPRSDDPPSQRLHRASSMDVARDERSEAGGGSSRRRGAIAPST